MLVQSFQGGNIGHGHVLYHLNGKLFIGLDLEIKDIMQKLKSNGKPLGTCEVEMESIVEHNQYLTH